MYFCFHTGIRMGKKHKDFTSAQQSRLRELNPGKCKTKCCKKYKKGEQKRCKKCPCYDLLKKVA